MSPARALIALSLAGCVDHMSIGAIGEQRDASVLVDAGPTIRDASVVLDSTQIVDADAADADLGASDASFGGSDAGLSLRMRAFGREDVVNLVANCNGSCIDVEAIPEGGAPPYHFQWWDAHTERKRRYCPSDGGNQPVLGTVVSVTDARGESADVPLTAFLSAAECAPDAEPTPWQVCIADPPPGVPDCPSPQAPGTWFPLRQPLENAISVVAFWSGAFLFPTRMVVAVRTRVCGDLTVLSERTLGLFDSPIALIPPWYVDSVLVQFPDQPDGKPPPGVNVTVGSLCFSAL